MAALMTVSMIAGSCMVAGAEELNVPESTDYKVALVIAGTLGDKSFYDSANEGLQKLADEIEGFEFKVEQMGGGAADQVNWEPTLLDYCDTGDYDIIVTGSWQMADALCNAADMYPDQKFIYFDETYDFESYGNNENIYNVLFKQNEVSFLAGAVAGLMTKTEGIEGIDPSNNVISLLGGQDSIVINDFVVGYIQGAKEVNPDIQVAVSYVGNYDDSAKGKDLSLAMYNAGADVGFNVAGNAGNGLIEAAGETGKYAIGVDSDQNYLAPETVITSAMKRVDNAVFDTVEKLVNGTLDGGVTTYDLTNAGVDIAPTTTLLPEDVITAVEDVKEKIIAGEIEVPSSKDAFEAAHGDVYELD